MLSKVFDNGEIKLCDILLPPYQVASLGFFLSQSKRNWKVLNLSGCVINDYGIILLHHYLCGYRTNKQVIESVTLIKNNQTEMSSPFVSDIINHFQLKELTISADEISVTDISDAITNSVTIKTLNLYRKPTEYDGYGYSYVAKHITAEELSAICDMMMWLERLSIAGNELDDNAGMKLSEGLIKSNTLKELDLSENMMQV